MKWAECKMRSFPRGVRSWRVKTHRTAAVVLLAVVSAASSIGCHPDRFDEPVPIMLDRERGVNQRLAAARQLGSLEGPDVPASSRNALSQLAWSDRQPIELRRYAIDRLIEHDPVAFQRAADQRIAQVQAWPALQHIFDQAAARGWHEFTLTAVRSYARPSTRYTDRQRPEHALIAALHPDRPVEAVVYDTFMGVSGRETAAHQVAAWTVLTRLLDESTLRAYLDAAPPVTPVVTDLQAAASLLDALPRGREQLLWLARLRSLDGGRAWSLVADRVKALSSGERTGLALRHLPVLMHSPPSTAGLSSAATLRARIRDRLASRPRVTRTEGVPEDWTESFKAQGDVLPWGDLLALQTLQYAVRTPAVREALFKQAERDRQDELSEHGGAIVFTGERWEATPFEPAFRLHDRKFIASRALIKQMHTALAHYHFHAQQHVNQAYAAPGKGDLAFAERFGVHAVVLTFVDRDTLNVDYYQPDGVVIDLGSVTRDGAAQTREESHG